MVKSMPSVAAYIEKYGKENGRKRYNRWHVLHRKRNKPRMLKYWKDRREAQKASKHAVSSGL
jgi:hypothetical protein